MGSVPLFARVNRAYRADAQIARQSRTFTSWCVPQISRSGDLMELAPRWVESDPSHRVPVIGDLLCKHSEEIQG